MASGRPTMDYAGLKQVFRFEVSRFPYVPEERQRVLRRAYRELEAALRAAVRELEYEWGDPRRIPPRLLRSRLVKIHDALEEIQKEHGLHFSPELRGGLETLCEHIRRLREGIGRGQGGLGPALKELSLRLEELKRILGQVHRL